MFGNIKSRKLKKLFLWKYAFQLICTPIFLGIIADMCFIIAEFIRLGFEGMINRMFIETDYFWGIPIKGWSIGFIIMAFCNLPNVLSLPTFVKLILDCCGRNNVMEKEIQIKKLFPYYELQCLREKKRFICDTFSKKKNVEIYIYDEQKKKYRFLWNEGYGGSAEEVERILLGDNLRVKIKYLKHSKIIVGCGAEGV